LWSNVPGLLRSEDTAAGGYLEKLLKAYGDELEWMRARIGEIGVQRDPFLCRGRDGEGRWYYFTATEVATGTPYGTVLVLREPAVATAFPFEPGTNPPEWTPYAPVTEIGPGWACDWQGSRRQVVAVRTREYDGLTPALSVANEVWLASAPSEAWPFVRYGVQIGQGDGTDQPTVTLPDAPWRMQRNATAAPLPWLTSQAALIVRYPSVGAGAVVALYEVPSDPYDGTGRLYPEDALNPGEIDVTTYPSGLGTVDYERAVVTVDLSPAGDTAALGDPITADWRVDGYYLQFFRPSLLTWLAKDFGFNNDENDPEPVQRATIAHATTYLGMKATWDSYRVRGEISGFWVNVQALHTLYDEGFAALLPADRVYRYGSLWYTTVEPRACRFDDIAADVLVYDPEDGEYLQLVDDCFIYEDYTLDGMSTGMAFAMDVAQGFYYPGREPVVVTAVERATEASLSALGLGDGIIVTMRILKEQYADFNIRRGVFGLTAYDKLGGVPPDPVDFVWWIDADLGVTADVDPECWIWRVLVGQDSTGVQPAVGADIAVRYWPDLLADDCGFCRSNRIRVEIEPLDGPRGALSMYDDWGGVDAAAERLINKIKATLVPIHVRVMEYVLVSLTEITVPPVTLSGGIEIEFVTVVPFAEHFDMPGIIGDVLPLDGVVTPVAGELVITAQYEQTGVDLGNTVSMTVDPTDFMGATEIRLTVAQRGDLNEVGETQAVWIEDAGAVTVWSATGLASGFDDMVWRDHPSVTSIDVTSLLAGVSPVTLRASGTAAVGVGEVRWTFVVTR
jgi:hypothetical protein